METKGTRLRLQSWSGDLQDPKAMRVWWVFQVHQVGRASQVSTDGLTRVDGLIQQLKPSVTQTITYVLGLCCKIVNFNCVPFGIHQVVWFKMIPDLLKYMFIGKNYI